jgi:hypothetical protein
LTAQEKRIYQDTEENRDRHSNGLPNKEEWDSNISVIIP